MSPEVLSIITVGIVILIAIATANRSLRRDLGERITTVQRELTEARRELGERITAVQQELGERITTVQQELGERIATVQQELGERIATVQQELGGRIDGLSERLSDVRERLGRVEGLLEGFGLPRRRREGKGRGGEEHGPALPRS